MINSPDSSSAPVLREPQPGDLPQLRPILEHWIKDRDTGEVIPSEVAKVLGLVESQTQGNNDRYFMVATESDGQVIGLMGVQDASEAMLPFTSNPDNPNAAEIVNAYVSPNARTRGIGRLLLKSLESHARQLAFEEIVVNSGPRYKDSGWPFWTAVYGAPTGTAYGLYGPSGDAPVWRKELSGQK